MGEIEVKEVKVVKPFWERTSTKVGVLALSHAAAIAAGFYYGKYLSGGTDAGEVTVDEL